MRLCALRLQLVVQIEGFAIHANADKPLTLEFLKERTNIAVCLLDHGREHNDSRIFRQRQKLLRNLWRRHFFQRLAGRRIMRLSCCGIKHAEIIINLRHRGNGGTRIGRSGSLLNGHGRRKAVNEIHLRFVQPVEELTGIGGKALHIAPLPFCIKSIKCQRRLARSADAREHNQFPARNIDVDIF